MTKAEMMNQLDDVFTDRRLTHADVEQALAAAGTEPAVLLGSYSPSPPAAARGNAGCSYSTSPARRSSTAR